MAKRPAFQFYPADWRNNLNLRRCSEGARGAWIEILCILHDSDEYGVVRFSLKELAKTAGISLKSAKELVEKGVLKGDEKNAESYIYKPRHAGKEGDPVELVKAVEGEPVWYCSRFVRDEYIRFQRGKSTQFAPPPKDPPNPTIGEDLGDGSSTTSTSSTSVSERESADALDLSEGKQYVRPDYAPTMEQTLMWFSHKGYPEYAEAFMSENDKVNWQYRDGSPIKNWENWAMGFFNRARKSAEKAAAKEAKKSRTAAKQSTYVPTRKDFNNEAEWQYHLQQLAQA